MGFFGMMGGHTDDGDDEAGLTCMISNSRLPENYEPGRFHIFAIGMYVIVKPKTASIFSGLGKHGGTPPIAPDGVELSPDAARLMIVFYCPKSILSPDGNSIPFASLPNGTTMTLGPEITAPLCDVFQISYLYILTYISIFLFQRSGARVMDVTGDCVWSHDGGAVLQQISHLKLMSMGFLQACGFFSEQMPYDVDIDVNMFLGAFSIKVDGQSIRPPSWVQNENNSVMIVPSASTSSTPPSELSTSPPVFNMDDYRRCRQAEALRWIDLQEKRSSIIARLQPTSADEYQKLREAVTSESGPLRRKIKKQTGMKICLYQYVTKHSFTQQPNGLHKIKTTTILPIY